MTEADRIREVFERNANALSVRPSLGHMKEVAVVRVKNGLTCEISEGGRSIIADMPEIAGGNNSGPTPSALGRAALGSCLAIGYTWWAAKLDVPVSSVEVEVHTEEDAGGMYAVGNLRAGFARVRRVVNIETSAPEADVQQVLDNADAHSPLLSDFRAVPVEREIHIVPAAG